MALHPPAPGVLLCRCKAVAILDALVSPSDLSRRYFFADKWSDGARLASMSDGRGNEYHVAFMHAGVFIRGFDHESPMSPAVNDDEPWPELIDNVPPAFAELLSEPIFAYEGQLNATYCIWREASESEWRTGDIEFPASAGGDVDGSGQLAVLCDEGPDTYARFAEKFYGRSVDSAAARRVWDLEELIDDIVRGLRPDREAASFGTEAGIVGYPTTNL